MSDRHIPFAQPLLGAEEEHAVIEVLRSGWLTAGPRVRDFEAHFGDYVGNNFSVAVSSATSALFLILKSLKIGPGDEVVTTPFTFASTASTIALTGAHPVFADISSTSLNLDPEKVEECISERTKAVVVVHFAGRPADLDEMRRVTRKHNLYLIEDAAHALGSRYKGDRVGSQSEFAAFSFYPTKNMTAAEGGMLVTSDPEVARSARILRWYGLEEAIWEREQGPFFDASDLVIPSFKFNMSDIQAAIGICQLGKLEQFNQKRAEYARRYRDLLQDVPPISLPLDDCLDYESSWHLFVIRLRTSKVTRKELCAALAARGIGTSYHYKSLHLHSYFRGQAEEWDLPNATAASQEVVSLPLYPRMELEDIDHVAESLREVLREIAR